MWIEYVLIEKQAPDKMTADKKRIVELFKQCYFAVSSEKITINGKRKMFELPYSISCTAVTSDESTDFVYNIAISCEHSDKMKNAELLEKAHVAFRNQVAPLKDYHIIVASDELSEYYCNRIYPRFQKFERQLRHLIFKVVTKAYGNLWTTKTLSPEQKKSLKEEIKSRSGSTKEDILIEAALHEMTMGQLVDYLFYGNPEIVLTDYLDEHYSAAAIKKLTKEELSQLIERGRRKSIWNLYLADDFDIVEPQAKLKQLKDYRNHVAHCKELYYPEYSKAKEYLDLFGPKIEAAIEKAKIQEPLSVREVLLGFGEFTMELANMAQRIGKLITPAIQQIAEIGMSIRRAYQSEAVTSALRVMEALTKSIAPSMIEPISQVHVTNSPWLDNPALEAIQKQQDLISSFTYSPIDHLNIPPMIEVPLAPSDGNTQADTESFEDDGQTTK